MVDATIHSGTSRSEELGETTRSAAAAADNGRYSGTSRSGDVGEAMRSAVAAASRSLNANFFTWELKQIAGSVGGFLGANDVIVTIAARAPGASTSLDTLTEAKSTGWHAWQNRMPGGPVTLHVTGVCVFPTSGYAAELRAAVPQGFVPNIYVLELIVTPPTGPVSQEITEVPVRYIEKTDKLFSDVQIVPENILVPVLQAW